MDRNEVIEAVRRAIQMEGMSDVDDLGVLLQYLQCDCEFQIVKTTPDSITVEVDHKTFTTFESDRHDRGTKKVVVLLKPPFKMPPPPRIEGVKYDYTPDELIQLCADAVVPESQWRNRDSPSAQEQIGRLRGFLISGKPFTIVHDHGRCSTDAQTVWVECEGDNFYVPTQARLDSRAGGDWY